MNNTSRIFNFPLLPKRILVPWTGIFLTLCVTGTMACLMLIVLILSKRQFRKGCGLFIVQSSTAGAILCSVTCTISCAQVYYKNTGHPAILAQYCNVIIWLQMICRCLINWMEVCVATNRIVAIYFPHQYRIFTGKVITACIISISWLVSGIYGLFPCFGIGGRYVLSPLGQCIIALDPGIFGMLNNLFGAYLPLGVAFGCFGLVYIKIVIGKLQSGAEVREEKAKSLNRRMKIANMLFAAFIWNAICFLTAPVCMVIMPNIIITNQGFVLFFMALTVAGYGFQPMIYCGLNKDYRAVCFFSMNCLNRKRGIRPMELFLTDSATRPAGSSANYSRAKRENMASDHVM